MKTKLFLVIVALFSAAVSVNASNPAPAVAEITMTVSPNSPKRTAYVRGDVLRPLAIYDFKNTGTAPATINELVFEKASAVSDVAVEFEGIIYPAYTYQNLQNLVSVKCRASIPVGATLSLIVKGSLGTGSSAFVDPYDIDCNAFVIPPTEFSAMHAIVEELPIEGITNTSCKVKVAPGDTVTFGFVVKGEEFYSYPVLIRAVGPTLKQFGVTNTLERPAIKLYAPDGRVMRKNANWQVNDDMQDISLRSRQAGAFPLDKACMDAAVFTFLWNGAYTIEVKGDDLGDTGEVLIEVYQLPRSLR